MQLFVVFQKSLKNAGRIVRPVENSWVWSSLATDLVFRHSPHPCNPTAPSYCTCPTCTFSVLAPHALILHLPHMHLPALAPPHLYLSLASPPATKAPESPAAPARRRAVEKARILKSGMQELSNYGIGLDWIRLDSRQHGLYRCNHSIGSHGIGLEFIG